MRPCRVLTGLSVPLHGHFESFFPQLQGFAREWIEANVSLSPPGRGLG